MAAEKNVEDAVAGFKPRQRPRIALQNTAKQKGRPQGGLTVLIALLIRTPATSGYPPFAAALAHHSSAIRTFQ